jgi:hypothetical protein
MLMERGATRRDMGQYGFRPWWMPVGRLTPRATGLISSLGDGPGLMTRRGDLLPSIMAAGFMRKAIGDGRLVPITADGTAAGTLQRWWRGLVAPLGA